MLKKFQNYRGYLLIEGLVALVILSVLVGLLLPLLTTSKQVESKQNEGLQAMRYLFEVSEEGLTDNQTLKRTYQNNQAFFTVTLTPEKGQVRTLAGEILLEVVLLNE